MICSSVCRFRVMAPSCGAHHSTGELPSQWSSFQGEDHGYRRKDIGLLRLFLPHELHVVFKAIHKMERGLRDLIARKSSEEFRGVYLEEGLNPTRKNVLAPGSLGVYSGGNSYNPAQVLRDETVKSATEEINKKLEDVKNKQYVEISLTKLQQLVKLIKPDPEAAEQVWDSVAISESLMQYSSLYEKTTGYLYVDRDRELKVNRRETQGILTGGEAGVVPDDKVTLFLLRTEQSKGRSASWWPQVRFPDGAYAFAFAV